MRSQFSDAVPRLRVIAACGIVLALALQACTVVQHRPDVVIGTGRPGGVYFPLGDSIVACSISICRVAACAAQHLSRGPVVNIESLTDSASISASCVGCPGRRDRGEGPFASRGPDSALRVLFTGQTEAFTIVARRESIRRAPELRGKSINLGSPGSGERSAWSASWRRLASSPRISPQLANCLSPSSTPLMRE